MTDVVIQIDAILDDAHAFRQKCLNDRTLSDFGKNEAITAKERSAKSHAQALALQALQNAQQAVESAIDTYNELSAQHSDSVDATRQSVAHVEAQTLSQTASGYADIAAAAERAIAHRDVAMLRSLVAIAIPLASQRFGNMTIGAARGDRGSLETLKQRLQLELDELRPEPLKEAERALEFAQDEALRIRRGLESLNFRWSQRTGGAGPLQPQNDMFVADFRNVRIKQKSSQPWP